MIKKFADNPHFLLRYYSAQLITYLVGTGIVHYLRQPSYTSDSWYWGFVLLLIVSPRFVVMAGGVVVAMAISSASSPTLHYPETLGLISLGVLLGIMSASWMHNAAHGNFSPRWVNTVVGELCGLHQLLGFKGWKLFHQMHHRRPDDPLLDPHPPASHTYWRYVNQMKNLIQACAARCYFQAHGTSRTSRWTWRSTVASLYAGRFMRGVFIFTLLEPKLFAWIYGPSLAANILVYCHFNFVTHRSTRDGSVEILNLNSGLGYRLLNFLTSGAYFHFNHHLWPNLFDPRRVSAMREHQIR